MLMQPHIEQMQAAAGDIYIRTEAAAALQFYGAYAVQRIIGKESVTARGGGAVIIHGQALPEPGNLVSVP
jgi:hypothetical protein